ncbi:MAG: Asp-tRNA(Asn)/Glu-tRNA(Gln) amidotransferase subunit GatB [Acidimicrobiia bacterium]|nr:MAG: Asp-tRNA(Asn)/Glu-tRNA(Gln) amidotransferase subunit GatB [Acidimicrobiia bacterium]
MTVWEAVIGIETHVELSTISKMFCSCPVDVEEEPNTACCPVCLALPGALPVPNEKAIEGIVKIGLALDCEINESSLFYRKNYFYPDLPKNYQISQYTFPVCEHGKLDVDVDGTTKTIGITRVHMEEDTGKSTHVGDGGGRIHDANYTLLDFNRAGIPLVEVVSEPDIRSAEQARAYGAELQRIVLALGVSDAKLEAGSMRFDVNVSVRPIGQEEFGTRTETKNVNSLRSVQRTIEFEIDRQIKVLEAGGEVHLETRHWNEDTGVTTSMRTKEESEDYRYFQDPDLLPLEVTAGWQDEIRASIPELPAARRARFIDAGTDVVTAGVLVDGPDLGVLFEQALAQGASGRSVGIWLTGEVVAYTRRKEISVSQTPLTAAHLVELTEMVDEGKLSSSAAKEVLISVLDGDGPPSAVAEARDLLQVSDTGAIEAAIDQVLAENAEAVDKVRSGDMKPFGFLVGQVMRRMGGRADPTIVQQLLRSRTSP